MRTKDKPLSWPAMVILMALALFLGAYYRFPDLDLRPMHLDEAVLGYKYLEYREAGHFAYDPRDYHGPTLHYLTHLTGLVLGWNDLSALTEANLRTVTALCGIALLLLTLALKDVLGRHGTVVAMLLVAVSPMQVFYSRYFIMEMFFVLCLMLLLVSLWRYYQTFAHRWLLLAGASLGLQHATKETFVINIVAMVAAFAAAHFFAGGFTAQSRGLKSSFSTSRKATRQPLLWVSLTALVVSAALFSGGFRFWDDVVESFTTYASYLKRSEGVGHEKAWSYYIKLLVWHQDRYLWTELGILVLAAVGMLRAFFGTFNKDTHIKSFLIFLSVYSLIALAFYSAIPYKTPWTILSVQHALILLAGAGAQGLYLAAKNRFARGVMNISLIAIIYHLCGQTMMTLNDRGQANLNAPYVYAHTTPSAMQLLEKLRTLSRLQPDEFHVEFINRDSGWPFPWYLRDLADKIHYQMTLPAKLSAPIIVVDWELQAEATALLGGRDYHPGIYGLRPGVNLSLLVERSLWEKYLAASEPTSSTK
jgi:uncharacterized protein (TIGR03663 family)